MYTEITYQDWLATPEDERAEMALRVVRRYKGSTDFLMARDASRYFAADRTKVSGKVMMRAKKLRVKGTDGRERSMIGSEDIVGNRIASNFFFRFVTQQNQYLLGNGVTLKDEGAKSRLGIGFDKTLEQIGEKALLHGVCWGYWNLDHIEVLPAYKDDLSGFVVLLDERTGDAGVGIQFWQLSTKRPMYMRVFEADGVSEYRVDKTTVTELAAKRAYRQTWIRDALGDELIGESNYDRLPIIPFFASETRTSELTPAIKSKIDLYDNILSDFGDNLDRANDVYWVLNNFGGTTEDIVNTLTEIQRIKAVANISDGTGNGSTAEPHTIEVPYAARQTALDLLQKALYSDYMALNMSELTGSSLTNVAIETAMTNLNLKADRYEWQAFAFVQRVLSLIGIETEEIKFKRQSIANKSEIVQDIATMRSDIDRETALKLNPYIDQEEIQQIMENLDAEEVSGLPSVDRLQEEIEDGDS